MIYSYADLRAIHYDAAVREYGVQKLRKDQEKTNRVHAAITRVVARFGSGKALAYPRDVKRAVADELGVWGLARAFPWMSLLMQLIQILLPIFLNWLNAESEIYQRTKGRAEDLDHHLRQLAMEAPADA